MARILSGKLQASRTVPASPRAGDQLPGETQIRQAAQGQRVQPRHGTGKKQGQILTLLYGNVQSVSRKIGELAAKICEINPDLILLTETWLNSSTNNAALSIEGYDIVPELRLDRNTTAGGVGGGLLVYVRDGLTVVPYAARCGFHQHCSFKLLTESGALDFILIYRPPSTGAENIGELCKLLEGVKMNTFIIGDFNLPGTKWEEGISDSRGRPVLEAAMEAGLEQLVEGPTHI